jgi:hypothetical protein
MTCSSAVPNSRSKSSVRKMHATADAAYAGSSRKRKSPWKLSSNLP